MRPTLHGSADTGRVWVRFRGRRAADSSTKTLGHVPKGFRWTLVVLPWAVGRVRGWFA